MKPNNDAIFFIINTIRNFGRIFLDNGHYKKVITASSISALLGYILGGIAWFAIPFLTATTMGLSAVALESSPTFPTYPNRLSPSDVSSGLTLPAAAVALLRKSGAVVSLAMVFMACTSAMSAQLIAVSSIIIYDIYKSYINPSGIGKKLIYISYISVVILGITMSIWSIGLYYIEVNMGYLYAMMGIIISSAVIPGAFTLLWKRQSKLAACLSPPFGFICSMISWLMTTKIQLGEINIQTSGSDLPMFVGNVVALLSPIIFIPILTLIKPDSQPYDFVSMRAIELIDDGLGITHKPTVEETEQILDFARIMAIGLTLCLAVIWPWPMYGSSYIFTKKFFIGWIILGIVWMYFSFCIVGIYQIIENPHENRFQMKDTEQQEI